MNESNRTPLLNAKTGKTGGTYIMKKGGDSSPPAAQAQGRQFANKYQKNAALMQKTFDLAQAAHPVACIVTILFKALAIFCYLFLNTIANQVLSFILVVVFSAIDFWTVKNVTGRLLVGLRWWSAPDENGDEDWYFESYDQRLIPNPVDSRFFWYSLMAQFVVWLVFSVFSVIGFRIFWGTACVISCILSGTNLWGFYKCSKDHEKKVTDILKGAGSKAMNKVVFKFTGNKKEGNN